MDGCGERMKKGKKRKIDKKSCAFLLRSRKKTLRLG
jgi:hypothetical protein